jgi:hypothetical protein
MKTICLDWTVGKSYLGKPSDSRTDALFKSKEFHRGLTPVLSVRPSFLGVELCTLYFS